MEPADAPAYDGWQLVGEEPYDDAHLAELRFGIKRNGRLTRIWRLAAIINSLFLISGPLVIGVAYGTPLFGLVNVGLELAIPLEVFLVLLWWGYSSNVKIDLERERAGGYWVYAPVDEQAVESRVDREGGFIGPDGCWRTPRVSK